MNSSNQLAIDGGPKAKTVPYATGQRYQDHEIDYLRDALAQNTLFYGFGRQVKKACEMMVAYTGMPYVAACSSGSAAVHLGLIAAGIGPGDEIICTPNTDTGSVLGIIEEGAVPIFCDCELNLQPSAASVAAKLTDRTKAVEVVHLAGYPAPVDEIVALCEPRGIAVIEDCAQSWGATLHGKGVGSFSTAGCYSTNDYKHLSTGDGGFVALRDAELYRRVVNYADKHYDRLWGDRQRDHHGINYRMSELQGAVAVAQLEKADAITEAWHRAGEGVLSGIEDLPGVSVIRPIPGGYSSYWWTVFRVDWDRFTATREQVVAAIQAEGIPVSSYDKYDLIGAGVFQTRQVRPWLEGERAQYPFVQPDGRSYTYDYESTPNHRHLLDTGLRMQFGPWFTQQDIDETVVGIRKVFHAYTK